MQGFQLITLLALISYMPYVAAALGIRHTDPSQLHPVTTFETDDCILTVLEDNAGHPLIAKMIKSADPEEQALLVIDCCASAIGCAIGIPINHVRLLCPAEKLAEWCHQLATLHEWAPGECTADALPWDGFTLQQRYRVPGTWQWERWGPLPFERMGLSREVIRTMAQHDDLARIAALDTFLGNADRSTPNLYYDSESQQFFGIDQAAAFRRPLAQVAIDQLTVLADEGFSEQELAGLHLYASTLVALRDTVTPDVMENWLKALAEESKLVGISDRVRVATRRFSENYEDIHALIKLLEEITPPTWRSRT